MIRTVYSTFLIFLLCFKRHKSILLVYNIRTMSLKLQSLGLSHWHSSLLVLFFSYLCFPFPQSSCWHKCGLNLSKSFQNNFKWVCVATFQSFKILFYICNLATGKLSCVHVLLNGVILYITFCLLLFSSQKLFFFWALPVLTHINSAHSFKPQENISA